MPLVLFWIFAILMLAFGLGVVFLRNPVSSALSLVMSFVALAALIMLLDLRGEETRRLNLAAWTGGGLVVAGFVGLLFKVVSTQPGFDFPKPPISRPEISDVALVGWTLFYKFNLPFQIIGVLLLVATIGVVLLSKKELK